MAGSEIPQQEMIFQSTSKFGEFPASHGADYQRFHGDTTKNVLIFSDSMGIHDDSIYPAW